MITVPWNTSPEQLPQIIKSNFPKIDDSSDQIVCSKEYNTIDDECGYFYGTIHKITRQPSGYGIFKTKSGWIIIGRVQNGRFAPEKCASLNFDLMEATTST